MAGAHAVGDGVVQAGAAGLKDGVNHEDAVGLDELKEIGRNLVEAARYIVENDVQIAGSENLDLWKGKEGACPHCHGNAFYIFPGTTHAVCEYCGMEGRLLPLRGNRQGVVKGVLITVGGEFADAVGHMGGVEPVLEAVAVLW